VKITRWFVICGIVLFATLSIAPAHAQYVGGQPPHNGSVDKGQPSSEPPAQVLGEHFGQPAAANAVTPPGATHSSSNFPFGKILGAATAIATLALLWFLFVWKRRKDEDEDDDVSDILGGGKFPGLPGQAPS
jgi:hypothetical protein